MIVYGTLSGFSKEEVDRFGFPIDGIQLQLSKEVLSDEIQELTPGTDLFFDIFRAEWYYDKELLCFKATCESITIDGNECALSINGDLVCELVKNSKLTEIVLSGDYIDSCNESVNSPIKKKKKKNRRYKVIGSFGFHIGKRFLYRKTNKAVFY